MHLALASDSSDTAFAPEQFTRGDFELVAAGASQGENALKTLRALRQESAADVTAAAARLLRSRVASSR